MKIFLVKIYLASKNRLNGANISKTFFSFPTGSLSKP